MSTRMTVEHGEGFHLFTDLFDGRHVYLELEGVEFTARPRSVVVAIPVEIWRKIRAHDPRPEDLADLSEPEEGQGEDTLPPPQ